MKSTLLKTLFLILVLILNVGILSQLSAQKWDTLAPVPISMTFPVATVLNGQIHVMGGGASGGANKSHFVYDPATNKWDTKAVVPYYAQQPAGTANNGKIHYFGGGFPNTGTPLKDHYVYDPVGDAWIKAADLTQARAIHSAVSLDGTLYSLGGQGVSNLCQTYDEVNDKWVTKSNLPDNSFWYGAHVPAEGHIYRFCGGGYTAPTNKADVYDPLTDTWSSLPVFPHANHSIRGAAIGDKIYLAGGYYDFLDRDEVWVYDTKAKTYTALTKLPIGRSYLSVVAIDSCIYSIGGNNAIDATVSTQLLRLCPYKFPTSVKEQLSSTLINANYSEGNVNIWLPEEISGSIKFELVDQLGRSILTRAITPINDNKLEILVDQLLPAIYYARLQSNNKVYLAKIPVF